MGIVIGWLKTHIREAVPLCVFLCCQQLIILEADHCDSTFCNTELAHICVISTWVTHCSTLNFIQLLPVCI